MRVWRICFLALGLSSTAALIWPQAAAVKEGGADKTYKNRKDKFLLRYPATWTEKSGAPGIVVTIASPDGAADVQIRTESVKGQTTACDLLTQLEGVGATAMKNVIPEDKRKPEVGQLSSVGVPDGCIGAYRVLQADLEVLQGIGIYVKGRKAWILIQNLRETAREIHGRAVSEIARSFAVK